jgi:hypothetical protein
MRVSVAALGLSVCLAVASCGKSDNGKTVVYSGNNGTVTATQSGNGEHVVVHSASGNETVEFNSNGLANVSMPDFAPLYPGAKVTSSINATGANGGAMVAFTTSAAPGDVIAFYKQKSAAAGLASTFDMSQGDNMSYVAAKDKKSLQVIAAKSSNGTQATVTWTAGN